MKRFGVLSVIIIVLIFADLPSVLGGEKLKFGTAIKVAPTYFLPMLAAQEEGFWEKNGLEVEWAPFRGSSALFRGVAAGATRIGFSPAVSNIQAAGRGIPAVIVSELLPKDPNFVWVMTKSPLRRPKDLKGTKIGVPRFGGLAHAYTRLVVREFGLQREIKIVATGGVVEKLGALRAGVIDAMTGTLGSTLRLKMRGEVRELLAVSDHLPREWIAHVVFAVKKAVKDDPQTVRSAVNAVLQATTFIRKHPRWAVQKMKSEAGYSQETASVWHESLPFTKKGLVDRRAVENIRNFLLEYGLISKERTPPVGDLYTNKFVS